MMKLNNFFPSSLARDPERESYLHEKAMIMEKKSISRTYLAFDSDYDDEVLGYFSIGLKCLRVSDQTVVSNSMRKKMNIDDSTKVAQAYLLGQIGRDDRSPKGFGKVLLTEALDRFTSANRLVGCRMIRVDCTDELISYYTGNKFIHIGRNEKKDLNQLVILI